MHLMEPTQEIIPRHWFAVYTQSRHEKSLAKYLDHRKIEHYLPLYSSKRKWSDGSRVTLSLPLFPGYVFVRIARDERVRVLTLPGALQIITGTGGELSPIADSMIATLRDGLLERDAQPHPLLTEGQRARIRSGALAGMEGIVIRHKSNLRVVLTIEMIMRSIAVEVNGEDLEPVSSPWYDDLQESA